jgi:hypothetical protein
MSSETIYDYTCAIHGNFRGPFTTECPHCGDLGDSERVTPEPKALDTQVGGGHYKDMAIQPMEYSMKNGLDACQHTAIKYISRFRDKGGIEDLRKAKHVIDMLIQFEEEKGQ